MLPTIEPRQPVTVRCGEPGQVGDVVLAVLGHGALVHRIVWKSRSGTWVLTRGDARAIPDPPLEVRHIAGVVEAEDFSARFNQTLALRVVIAGALLGRVAAAMTVRALQIIEWSRSLTKSNI